MVGSVLKRSPDRVVRPYLVGSGIRLEAVGDLSTFGPALSLDPFSPAVPSADGVEPVWPGAEAELPGTPPGSPGASPALPGIVPVWPGAVDVPPPGLDPL